MPNNHATTPEERPEVTLGNHLRNARTSQGKSLQEVAQVICINPTILANLEADNFTKMPAEVFTRGFIKLYAQHLGLDANEMLKLYLGKDKLDPERPVDQPHRREISPDAAMAQPFNLFRSNPRMRILAILLGVLLVFYVLGAILKVVQKHPGQTTPENELAKSLVDGNTQPLPGPPGEPTTATGVTGLSGTPSSETTVTTLLEGIPGIGFVSGTPSATYPPAATGELPPFSPAAEKTVPAATTPMATGRR